MQRVGVVVHPTRAVVDAVNVLRDWTEERGLELVQIPTGQQPDVAPPGDVGPDGLIAALGGDGTVLKALHAAHGTGTPVLGVAYGSLGALAAVPQAELRASLERFATGDWFGQRLPALELASPERQLLASAINDVVIVRRGGTQLRVDVQVDGELYARVAGDGIVIATSLGSSAYSMAAGGPLLASPNAFICTPLAMHGGCAPPLVVDERQNVSLHVHPSHGGFELDVDGFKLETESDRFEIRWQGEYATLVGLEGSRGGVTRLRDRGLISDSPRVIEEARRQA